MAMGIFGFKEKYDINPKEEELKAFITNYNKVDVIKMNAKLIVPNGYIFVIGKKGKACDKFEAGEYFFNTSILPYMCRKFKIDKIKDGKSQDKIPAEMYFINKDLRGGIFKTYRKVNMGTKAYGFYSVKVMGMFTYRVADAGELMQSLLNEFDYIKTGEAEGIIEGWANETIVNELENQNFILKDVIANSPQITEVLKDKLSKIFKTAGLELVDLKITKYTLPKEYQAESDYNIKMQENATVATNMPLEHEEQKASEDVSDEQEYENDDIANDIFEAKKLLKEFGIGEDEQPINKEPLTEEFDSSLDIDEGIVEQLIEHDLDEDAILQSNDTVPLNSNDAVIAADGDDGYVPFGDFVISETDEEEKKIAKNVQPKKTFVDLSLNELYNDSANTKRCINCGTENDINANHCILCGEKFNTDN